MKTSYQEIQEGLDALILLFEKIHFLYLEAERPIRVCQSNEIGNDLILKLGIERELHIDPNNEDCYQELSEQVRKKTYYSKSRIPVGEFKLTSHKNG